MTCRAAVDQGLERNAGPESTKPAPDAGMVLEKVALPERLAREASERLTAWIGLDADPRVMPGIVTANVEVIATALRAALDAAKLAVRTSYEREDESPLEALARAAVTVEALKG